MGLVGHVTPSDGLLILLVANTAFSVSLLRDLIASFLSFLLPSQFDVITAITTKSTLRSLFFDRFEPARFDSVRLVPVDCCVCLSRFEPESMVSLLSCGHLLHKGCLETWMDYQHATCPLCRAHLLPDQHN